MATEDYAEKLNAWHSEISNCVDVMEFVFSVTDNGKIDFVWDLCHQRLEHLLENCPFPD